MIKEIGGRKNAKFKTNAHPNNNGAINVTKHH